MEAKRAFFMIDNYNKPAWSYCVMVGTQLSSAINVKFYYDDSPLHLTCLHLLYSHLLSLQMI